MENNSNEIQKITPENFQKVEDSYKNKLEVIHNRISKAEGNADEALKEAKKARQMKLGLFKQKKAIEKIQTVNIELSNALVEQSEIQLLMQEYQTYLTKVCGFLFELSSANMAMNKKAIEQLKRSVNKGESFGDFSFSNEDVLDAVKQLKSAQSIYDEFEQLKIKMKSLEEEIGPIKSNNQGSNNKTTIIAIAVAVASLIFSIISFIN